MGTETAVASSRHEVAAPAVVLHDVAARLHAAADEDDANAVLADLTDPAVARKPGVAAALLAVARGRGTAFRRAAALRGLGDLPRPDGARVEAIANLLRAETDAVVREAAAWALASIAERGKLHALVAKRAVESLEGEREAPVRMRLLEAVKDARDPVVADAVIAATERETDRDALGAALVAVREVAESQRANALAALVARFGRESDEPIRRAIVDAVVAVGGPDALPSVEMRLVALARAEDRCDDEHEHSEHSEH